MNHDGNYKQIFSHSQTVIELLQEFVREDWVERLDLTTLEKVNASYVSEALLQREDDIIWRVKLKGEWLYIYLLLEFQSGTDHWMALRIMVYIGLLYQDLIKSGRVTPKKRLPPVFPLVLYNGKERWSASLTLSELIEPFPSSLQSYHPNQRYFLLDEGRIEKQELEKSRGTVSEIIRLETSTNMEEVKQIIRRLTEQLKAPQHATLRRALTVWIQRMIVHRLSPTKELPEFNELREVGNMLAETVEQWAEDWMQQGLEQGIKQGVQQGMYLGKGKLLNQQIERRFDQIPSWAKERIDNATELELEKWANSILDASSLEEVFL